MKFGPVLTVSLLIYIVVSSVASAQVVDIPDPNLRAAIADALNLPNGRSNYTRGHSPAE